MGRPITIRTSYANDAGYLNRLVQAVDRDPKLSTKRKSAIVILLNESISIMLMSGDSAEKEAVEILRKFDKK